MINDKHSSLSYRMSMGTAVVYLYHPRCGIKCVHFEACGEDKSPGGAAITVRLLQKKEYSADQEPRWGCNNSEIVATSIVLMIRQPSEALLIGCAANLH